MLGAIGLHVRAGGTAPAFLALVVLASGLWSALTGFAVNRRRAALESGARHAMLLWPFSMFMMGVALPLLWLAMGSGDAAGTGPALPVGLIVLSCLSFGLGGAIIGACGILLQLLYWRWLHQSRWGTYLGCGLGIMLGLSAGWAAYGWTVFSTQAYLSVQALL
jgi:hypothetical protein